MKNTTSENIEFLLVYGAFNALSSFALSLLWFAILLLNLVKTQYYILGIKALNVANCNSNFVFILEKRDVFKVLKRLRKI